MNNPCAARTSLEVGEVNPTVNKYIAIYESGQEGRKEHNSAFVNNYYDLRVRILYGVLYLVPLCDQREANRTVVIGRGF